jgi:glutaminyl-tRNA synthetase
LSASGLSEAEASVLAQDAELLHLFRTASGHTDEHADLAKWIVNEVPRIREGRPVADLPFGGAELGRLVDLISSGAVSGRAAKDVLAVLATEGGDPAAVIEDLGLGQLSDASALEPLVAGVMERNPDKVEAYRGGKTGLLGFFVGQVLSETKGAADPELTQSLLRDALDGG